MRCAAVAALACALIAGTTPDATSEQRRAERILFIGNSLTFANDLPRMVR
jgi:hypothetical protein